MTDQDKLNTVTSKWTLVILRTSQTSARIWAGTLYPDLLKPAQAAIDITGGGQTQRITIRKAQWKRPFRKLGKRFYVCHDVTGLQPGTHYDVTFSREVESLGIRDSYWQPLRHACFDTLPEQLPAANAKPFTIGFGSCFYEHRDGSDTSTSYRALYELGKHYKPDITFLTGDQVYLDIGMDSLSVIPGEIRQRIADDYAKHWEALGNVLSLGATWMLPDDHEYWNDYPFYDSLIPTLLTLRLPPVREAWIQAAEDGVQRVQQSPILETFNIGDQLSCCLADLRSYRSDDSFLPEKIFNRLIKWTQTLNSPGILVLPQPLMVSKNPQERNLLSFKQQYTRLLGALENCGHDIVIISGDVHFGRIAQVKMGNSSNTLTELIASPLSNLTGLSGIATTRAEKGPKKLPGWPANIDYLDTGYFVDSERGWPVSPYPKTRTREHFMTASFNRAQGGKVRLRVNAWRVRERDEDNLPLKDFVKEFDITLS